MRKPIISLLLLFTAACGPQTTNLDKRSPRPTPHIAPSDAIVIATASFPVTVAGKRLYASSAIYPVVVTLAPNTQFAINTTSFAAPIMDNVVLNFGSIAVTTLSTNQLKLCGIGGNQKCNNAYIRVYTTGGGTGFWNVEDGYGAPMSAGLSGSLASVGYTIAAASVVQSFAIPTGRNTVKLSDFPSPIYLFSGDFTDAGAASYSATINIDLVLSL